MARTALSSLYRDLDWLPARRWRPAGPPP